MYVGEIRRKQRELLRTCMCMCKAEENQERNRRAAKAPCADLEQKRRGERLAERVDRCEAGAGEEEGKVRKRKNGWLRCNPF